MNALDPGAPIPPRPDPTPGANAGVPGPPATPAGLEASAGLADERSEGSAPGSSEVASEPSPNSAGIPPAESRRVLLAAVGTVLVILLAAGAAVIAQGGGSAKAAWSWSPAPRPTDWRYFGWGNPALELALPAEFEGTEMGIYEPDASASPDERKNQEAANARLRSGAARIAAVTAWTGSGGDWVSVFIESGDASLASFAERWLAQPWLAKTVERSDVQLPAGPAVAIKGTGQTRDIAFVEVDHLVRLPDGRSLAIVVERWSRAGAPPDPAAVQEFARKVAASLRVTP